MATARSDRSGGDPAGGSFPAGGRPLRIGGMALGNGLLLHSRRHWAAAVREKGGEVRVASGAKPWAGSREEGPVPLLRGLVRLADGLLVIIPARRALPTAVLPFQEPRVQAAVGASMLAAVGLRGGRRSLIERELSVMLVGVVPLLLALRGSELAAYHGAEHKSIGEYELTVAGRSEVATKEHERCGSNVVGPLLMTSFVSNVAVRALRPRPGPGAALVSGLVSLGAALEIFRWMSRHPLQPLSRALAWPGHVLQGSITTREPSEAQMEVARAALAELLAREHSDGGVAAAL